MRILVLLFLLISVGCSSTKKMKALPPVVKQVKPIVNEVAEISIEEALINTFNLEAPWKDHMTGLVITEVQSKQEVFAYKPNKYFTPASNMKLFTYYACLNVLDDREPIIEIEESNNNIYFRGTGHPAFLHPYLEKDTLAFNFLKHSKKPLIYDERHFQDEPFSPGWALDDATYYYQAEKSALPIYGNTFIITRPKGNSSYHLTPSYFQAFLQPTDKSYRLPRRALSSNKILLSKSIDPNREINHAIPFKYSPELLLELLGDTLDQNIIQGDTDVTYMPFGEYPSSLLYHALLKKSDNPIAEQLLLMASHKLFDTINTQKFIEYGLENYFSDLSDPPRWVDGSGLSRYNLATPKSINDVLLKIHDKIGMDSIRSQFAQIELETNGPFVYAKTGSLSNNFNLSGYLIAKSGKLYAFSFMNNHFMKSTREIYAEVKKVLLRVYEEY